MIPCALEAIGIAVLMFTRDQEPVTLVKRNIFAENTLTFGWYTHKINKHVALNQPIRLAESADVASTTHVCRHWPLGNHETNVEHMDQRIYVIYCS